MDEAYSVISEYMPIAARASTRRAPRNSKGWQRTEETPSEFVHLFEDTQSDQAPTQVVLIGDQRKPFHIRLTNSDPLPSAAFSHRHTAFPGMQLVTETKQPRDMNHWPFAHTMAGKMGNMSVVVGIDTGGEVYRGDNLRTRRSSSDTPVPKG